MKQLFLLVPIIFALAILTSCESASITPKINAESPDAPTTTPGQGETATEIPRPTKTHFPTETTGVTPNPVPILPHTLYYLEGADENSQVWRLGVDGISRMQMTHGASGVEEFAVSPSTGDIAYVSDQQLFLMDNDGKNLTLIADGQAVDQTVEDYVFRSWVDSPVFSPDGRILAYGFNGLHLYDLDAAEDEHVLENLGNLLGESYVFAKEAYSPGPWSPDGRMLLIVMGYYEGSTLAVMDLDAEQPFRRLWTDGPVCCQFTWAADSRSVLVANPYYTGDIPGLWRYDAVTGEQSLVIHGQEEDRSINFVGWPIQLHSGGLQFFYMNQERFSPDTGIPLTIVRSDMDGQNILPMRPETFRIFDVLWVEDGSEAIILRRGENDRVEAVLVRGDGSPLQVLLEGERIRNLAWGP